MTTRRRRERQRGQAVPIVALAFVVLIGATALAVDLSLQTHSRRSFQNVSDAAALAGARDLPTKVARSNQTTAVQTVFQTIQANLGLPANWQGTPSNSCSAVGVCESVSNYSFNGSTFSVTVNTPPQATPNSALKCPNNSPASTDPCLHNVEVILHGSSSSSNPLSGFLGFGAGTEGADSIAHHNGPDVPFGFALYSATSITTGNQLTKILGDVYAGRLISPQSNGNGEFCAADWTKPDGTASKGHVFLGALQQGDAGYARDGQYNNTNLNNNSWTAISTNDCTTLTGGQVGQTATLNSSNCVAPTGLPGGTAVSYNSATNVCEITPALPVPTFNPPTHTGNLTHIVHVSAANSNNNWNNDGKPRSFWPLPVPGLYDVAHTPGCLAPRCYDLTITVSLPAVLTGFTFYLEPGASIGVTGGQKLIVIPYNPNALTNVTSNTNDDGVYAVYADPGTSPDQAPELDVGVSGGQANGTSLDIQSGSIIMPTGTVDIGSNANLVIEAGQAVVNVWKDQSGNHPNPAITFSASGVPAEKEVLELVH